MGDSQSGIGSVVLNPPPPAGLAGDADFETLVTMAPGAGSWPHRHPPKHHAHRELEAFEWAGVGEMDVYVRQPEGGPWQHHRLDEDNQWVLVPPGWWHGIQTSNTGKGALFRAFTMPDHLRPPSEGGNVVRADYKDLPPEVRERIDAGFIK